MPSEILHAASGPTNPVAKCRYEKNGHSDNSARYPLLLGGLKRSTQHFIKCRIAKRSYGHLIGLAYQCGFVLFLGIADLML
jgi:hypothetical protein